MKNTNDIQNTVTYKMVCEEARELSVKWCNVLYVLQKGNTLFTSLVKEKGTILCAYNLGNLIIIEPHTPIDNKAMGVYL